GTSSQDGWAGDTSGTSSSSCGHRCSHSTTNGGGRCADPVASSEQSSSTDSGRSIQDSRRPPDERRLSSARQSRYREVVLGRSDAPAGRRRPMSAPRSPEERNTMGLPEEMTASLEEGL